MAMISEMGALPTAHLQRLLDALSAKEQRNWGQSVIVFAGAQMTGAVLSKLYSDPDFPSRRANAASCGGVGDDQRHGGRLDRRDGTQ